MSASSSRMFADFPPSSRKHFFTVAEQACMIARPVAVEPVKLTMSTRGSFTSASPASAPEDGRTFTTPGGMSVLSAISRPRMVAVHGVSGAGLITTVQPEASAGPSFARIR